MTHIQLQAKIALERWVELSHCRSGCIDTPIPVTLILGLTPCIELIWVMRCTPCAGLCPRISVALHSGGGLVLEMLQLKQGHVQTQRRGAEVVTSVSERSPCGSFMQADFISLLSTN